MKKIIFIVLLLFIFSCEEYKQPEYKITVVNTLFDKVIFSGIGYGYYTDRRFASDFVELTVYGKGGKLAVAYGSNLIVILEKIKDSE